MKPRGKIPFLLVRGRTFSSRGSMGCDFTLPKSQLLHQHRRLAAPSVETTLDQPGEIKQRNSELRLEKSAQRNTPSPTLPEDIETPAPENQCP